MGFNLNDYEPVAARLERFWADHPDGRIITRIVERTDTEVLFIAEVWIADVLIATGHAHEQVTARGVNSTSAVENAETSAIGRGLANASYASKVRPSREEMAKVQRSERQPAARERIDAARALIGDDEGRIAWAKATLTWPWTDDDCAQIEGRYGSGTETF